MCKVKRPRRFDAVVTLKYAQGHQHDYKWISSLNGPVGQDTAP